MDAVFHEKQEGALCAQHCLNVLLQGPYYSAVDLGTIAQQLDDEERERMAEAGVESEDYLRFMEAGSTNMDDSGYFSVQVLSKALQVWTLELVPYRSRSHANAERARAEPTSQRAFICNFREHWFAIRKLGHQWFNLNSLLSEPELISNTYLSLFLAQLEQEGYSIFVVIGNLPDCDADQLLKLVPAVQERPPKLLGERGSSGYRPDDSSRSSGGGGGGQSALSTTPIEDDEDEEMRLALAQSREEFESTDPTLQKVMRDTKADVEEEDSDLQMALALSKCCEPNENSEEDDRAQMEAAIALSLETDSQQEAASAEEVRAKRSAFLDRFNR